MRTEISNTRKLSTEKMRSERAQLQNEVDILNQKLTQDLLTLKDDLKGLFDDRKMAVRMEQRTMEGRIQELNYKITVALNSDSKSEVEGLRWVLTRRAAMAIACMACKCSYIASPISAVEAVRMLISREISPDPGLPALLILSSSCARGGTQTAGRVIRNDIIIEQWWGEAYSAVKGDEYADGGVGRYARWYQLGNESELRVVRIVSYTPIERHFRPCFRNHPIS